MGRNDIRIQMLDYVIGTFYPEIQAAHAADSVQRNAAFFREVGAAAGLLGSWAEGLTGCPCPSVGSSPSPTPGGRVGGGCAAEVCGPPGRGG